MKLVVLKQFPDYINISDEELRKLEKARLNILKNGRK